MSSREFYFFTTGAEGQRNNSPKKCIAKRTVGQWPPQRQFAFAALTVTLTVIGEAKKVLQLPELRRAVVAMRSAREKTRCQRLP
jgi:hypothetical protein